MLVVTTDVIPGHGIEVVGLVRGNVAYAKNIGRDLMAGLKNIAGGEIKSYTDMVNEARDIAERRMEQQAEALGANAVVAARFQTCAVADGTIEVVAYGTAVRLL